jgi:hypothetical protein
VIIGKIFVKAGSVQLFDSGAETFDTKRDVSFVDLHDSGFTPERIGNLNDVNLLAVSQREPCPGKRKVGTLQLGKSQEAAVKGAGFLDIRDRDLKVMERGCRHALR